MMAIKNRPLPYRECGKWGYLTIEGAVVRDAAFDYAGKFSEGFGYIEQASTITILDDHWRTYGQVRQCGSFSQFTNKLLVVSDIDTDQSFYVNIHGDRAFPAVFDNALRFASDRAFAKLGDKWGMLNLSGCWVIEPSFMWAVSFEPGSEVTSVCSAEKSSWHLIDRDGKRVSDRNFDLLRRVSEGLVPFGRTIATGRMLFGVADISGQEIIPPIFEECDDKFQGGMLGVATEDGSWGVIDRSGHWVIQPNYTYVGECKDGLLLAYRGGTRTESRALRDGKFGFISPSGAVKIDFEFDEAMPFDDGISRVDWFVDAARHSNETLMGYVSVDGRVIWREKEQRCQEP